VKRGGFLRSSHTLGRRLLMLRSKELLLLSTTSGGNVSGVASKSLKEGKRSLVGGLTGIRGYSYGEPGSETWLLWPKTGSPLLSRAGAETGRSSLFLKWRHLYKTTVLDSSGSEIQERRRELHGSHSGQVLSNELEKESKRVKSI